MNIVREQREQNNSLIKVTVGEKDYGDAVEKSLREYKRKANIPGFRPGMVPMGVIKKMYGKGVLAEQAYRQASEAAFNYLQEQKIDYVGDVIPSEEQGDFDFENGTEFEFIFEIGEAPEVKLELSAKDKMTYYTIKVDKKMHDDYRSNFLLLGVPIVENIYGTDHIGMPLLLSAFIIPIYNVLAVFTLETFRGNRHGFHPGTILMGIIKNPMIIGAILGFALKLLPPLPPLAVKTLRQLAACTTPVALVVLGASFNFSGAVKEIKEVAVCVVGRLLIAPFLTLGGAILIGIRGIPLASIMAMTITPCAVASFAMAQQMDSDGELAGNALVFTTIFSALTMFLWVYVLKEIGVL